MDQDTPMDQDDPPAKANSKENGDDLAEYNLDDYDEEDSAPG